MKAMVVVQDTTIQRVQMGKRYVTGTQGALIFDNKKVMTLTLTWKQAFILRGVHDTAAGPSVTQVFALQM